MKNYEKPEMIITSIESADVITTSGGINLAKFDKGLYTEVEF